MIQQSIVLFSFVLVLGLAIAAEAFCKWLIKSPARRKVVADLHFAIKSRGLALRAWASNMASQTATHAHKEYK